VVTYWPHQFFRFLRGFEDANSNHHLPQHLSKQFERTGSLFTVKGIGINATQHYTIEPSVIKDIYTAQIASKSKPVYSIPETTLTP
jgi:hypothetical protein